MLQELENLWPSVVDEYRVPKASDVSLPTSRHQLLSPCERFIEEKRQELNFKFEEASAKRKELEETSPKIRDAASALGNTGQRYVIVM